MTDELDREVRLHVYERFLEEGRPPTHLEVAEALRLGVEEAEASYRRLEAARVLVLAPGTPSIWMANPLSAYPTSFWVETPRGGYWAACVWDAFGLVSMLGGTGAISTFCPDCAEPIELRLADGALEPAEGLAHFAVPARRWWENIGYS